MAGTPLDFTAPAPLGARLADAPHPPDWPAGYDSNLALFGLTNMTARSNVHDCNAFPTCASMLNASMGCCRVNAWCHDRPLAAMAAVAT